MAAMSRVGWHDGYLFVRSPGCSGILTSKEKENNQSLQLFYAKNITIKIINYEKN